MKNFTCFLVIFSFLFVSCEKEIEFVGEGKQPLLVLDAILENHEVPTVYLTRSVFFLTNNTDPSSKEISGANVVLTNLDLNESYVLANTPSTGYYTGTVPIEPNTNYKIEVSYPNFKTITSQLKTVNDVVLDDIDTSSAVVEDQFFGTPTSYSINLKFQDPVGANFYSIGLNSLDEINKYNSDSVFLSTYNNVSTHFASSTDPSSKFYYNSTLFFDDVFFQGQYKVMPATTFISNFIEPDYQTGGYEVRKIVTWRATLRSMTEDTYLYFKSIPKNQGGSPFSDPTNVHSNVKNGLGIFGSVSVSVKEK
jgi:hypothetical protein